MIMTIKITKRIVLLEDNPHDIFLVREALRARDLNFELICYDDVPQALDGLRDESAPIPDAILLDLNLPKGEGIDVLEAVRSSLRLSHVPVAVLTSSLCPRDRERAIRLRVDRYIHKPTTLDDFLGEVGRAVDDLLHRPAASTRGASPAAG
jgi:CheY-like chemotaxis protein